MSDSQAAFMEMDFTDENDVIGAQESKPKSEYVDAAGTYHFAIAKMRNMETDEGDVIGFEACLTAIGTDSGNEEQIDKNHWERFRFGHASHKDGGVFCNSKIRAFMLACGKVDPTMRGTFTPEFSTAEYQDMQLIATIKQQPLPRNAKADARKYYEVDGLSFWHVDDTEVASVPKNEALLEYHTGIRWDAAMAEGVRVKREAARAKAESEKGAKGIKGHAVKKQMTQKEIDAAASDL